VGDGAETEASEGAGDGAHDAAGGREAASARRRRVGDEATERRLRARVEPRLEPGEIIRAWARAWVSPDARLRYLAPRHRDIVVVTDRRLMLWSVSRFLRRPRRRVLARRLTDLRCSAAPPHPERTVRCAVAGRRGLLLELGTDERSRVVVGLLVGPRTPTTGG
jgi:hypothetical protein